LPEGMLDWTRRLLPAGLKRFLREEYRQHRTARAIARARAALPSLDAGVVAALIEAWDNPGYSVKYDYVRAVVQATWGCRGPILECGSGISTLLLGLVGQRFGAEIVALEHDPYWASRVVTTLSKNRISSVDLRVTPLKDFGGYTWYETDPQTLPRDFSLVVCDGPPGETPGGRYGMLPHMRSLLRSGCVILLDDVDRADERNVLERWSRELGTSFVIHGTDNQYGTVVVP
jgi:predicted O-methyltransferase YrrM